MLKPNLRPTRTWLRLGIISKGTLLLSTPDGSLKENFGIHKSKFLTGNRTGVQNECLLQF